MSNHIISFHVHRKLKGKCHEDLEPYDIEKMCGMFKLILTYFILCIKRWNIIVAIVWIHFNMTNKLWRKQIDSVQYINPKIFILRIYLYEYCSELYIHTYIDVLKEGKIYVFALYQD